MLTCFQFKSPLWTFLEKTVCHSVSSQDIYKPWICLFRWHSITVNLAYSHLLNVQEANHWFLSLPQSSLLRYLFIVSSSVSTIPKRTMKEQSPVYKQHLKVILYLFWRLYLVHNNYPHRWKYKYSRWNG